MVFVSSESVGVDLILLYSVAPPSRQRNKKYNRREDTLKQRLANRRKLLVFFVEPINCLCSLV